MIGDCHNAKGQQGMCVVGAINNYTEQLYSYGDSKNTCKTNAMTIYHNNFEVKLVLFGFEF